MQRKLWINFLAFVFLRWIKMIFLLSISILCCVFCVLCRKFCWSKEKENFLFSLLSNELETEFLVRSRKTSFKSGSSCSLWLKNEKLYEKMTSLFLFSHFILTLERFKKKFNSKVCNVHQSKAKSIECRCW